MHWFQVTLLISVVWVSRLSAEPAQVIIIRHAEKPDEGNELSLAGRERAAALAPYFLGETALLRFGPPVAIYVQRRRKKLLRCAPLKRSSPWPMQSL